MESWTLVAVVETAGDLVTWTDQLLEIRYHPVQLLVSILIGATLGLVGCFVVLRRMALLGDALSHSVLPGVAIAFLVISRLAAARQEAGGAIGAAGEVWALSLGALLAGLLTTLGINVVARHSRVKEDTAIGIVFTAMFAIGVVLVSLFPRGTHFDLQCFLWGEPLAIKQHDLYVTLVVALTVVLTLGIFYRPLKLVSFDAQMAAASGVRVQFIHYLLMTLLSATVVTALQSVGVIMSVAMLITPAAIAYQLTNRLVIMLLISAAAGAVSAAAGMVLAFAANLPPGPAMVLVATALFAATMAFAPEYGVIAKAVRRRRIRRHILEEDVLKSLARLGPNADVAAIRTIVGQHVTPAEVEGTLSELGTQGLVTRAEGRSTLSANGQQRAENLVRSHRLWETYLAEHNFPQDLLHPVAEKLEHVHELAEELADELGNPQTDPHGEPIPAPRRAEER